MTGPEFESSRKALEAKRKDLRKQGKVSRLHAAESLTEGEENALWMVGDTCIKYNFYYTC